MSEPRLLIVDDEPDMRELIALSVEMAASWTVRAAATANEALQLLRDERFDGLVLDMMMPQMDGVQLLGEIRRIPGAASTPAVFLSGQTHPPADEVLQSLGVVGTIRKPFDPRTLAGELGRLFGWQS